MGTRQGIYAIHGDHNLAYPGYVVLTFGIGHNPGDAGGHDFTQYANTPIARLNNGYGTQGTLPLSDYYEQFAQRCANFVAASSGCSRWIIGNEPNMSVERPEGQPITPEMYARCYDYCRAWIHSVPGHADDEVLVAAIAPWNVQTVYPGNPSGSWIQYFEDVQYEVSTCDGFTLHTYVREQTPDSVVVNSRMDPPWQNYHNGFQTYTDWMAAILPHYRGKPVYITEFCVAGLPWQNANTGCVQMAYQDIYEWNVDHPDQPIHCLTMYRWAIDKWSFHDKPAVIADFMDAVSCEYTCPPYTEPVPPDDTEARLTALEADVARMQVQIADVIGRVEAAGLKLLGK